MLERRPINSVLSCERAQINGLMSILERRAFEGAGPEDEIDEVEQQALVHLRTCDNPLCKNGRSALEFWESLLGSYQDNIHLEGPKTNLHIKNSNDQYNLENKILKWGRDITRNLESS